VGPDSKPAAHLLSKVGFAYDHTIDPFDGGPTYRVNIHDCTLIQNLRLGRWAGSLPVNANSIQDGFLCLDRLQDNGHFLILQGKGYQIGADIFFDIQISDAEKSRKQQELIEHYQIPLKKGDHIAFVPFEV
jgi:arginine/ornithine N-succinyltransferase beta subunit